MLILRVFILERVVCCVVLWEEGSLNRRGGERMECLREWRRGVFLSFFFLSFRIRVS